MVKALILVGFFLLAQSAVAANLEITLENVEAAEGQVMIQVMRGEAAFKGEEPPFAALQRQASKGSITIILNDLPEGEYGLQIMHDVNGNGELDTNFVGMPREPWAFSNNATGNMGPPKWPDVKFQLQGSVQQSIQLNH